MAFEKDNLTNKQKDWAVFLPAISSFYATFIGKQRYDHYVDPARIPADFEHGIEGLNFLNEKEGYFPYKWALYSAGHANLDVNKFDASEDMVRNRDRANTFVLGDSGGFQIGKGVWQGNWKDPNCTKAAKKRKQVLEWMDTYMDRGMILDIPAWVCRSPAGQAATGITTYDEAVQGTYINNDYFMANRNGNCKFLNVLQGENHAQSDDWYERMKKYCDPKQYETPFEGWAMGGQNMCDPELVLRRIVRMKLDGLLEAGRHDWMHFLGTSKLEWACFLTDVQRAARKHYNPELTVSFDCASPFLAIANGQLYYETTLDDRKKWSYKMDPTADDRKYSSDARRFSDAVLQDGYFQNFTDSPVSTRCKISDVCVYQPGQLNKIGKLSKTSWDSFSYAIQMGHNAWFHIDAVQKANERYDAGLTPNMLVQESFDRVYSRDLVDAIFSTSDFGKAEKLIKEHSRFWMQIVGTRGATGKKAINASSQFDSLFTVSFAPESSDQETDLNEDKLDDLESSVKDE